MYTTLVFVRTESCSLAACCAPSSLRQKQTLLSAELIEEGNV